MKRFNKELRDYLQYELAPYPVLLFDEVGMHKTKKLSFFNNFTPSQLQPDFKNVTYVADGGFLLHRVVWHQNETFDSICTTYVNYVQKHFGSNTIIVFDIIIAATAMEQLRRSSKLLSADVLFDETMNVTVSQDKFLFNSNNKIRLISMLLEKFEANNFHIKHAQDDADVLIIEAALEQACKNTTVVVGEIIDLLVILIARTPIDKKIFFLKPGKGKDERKIYSSRNFDEHKSSKDLILFLHAFSGCNTTSALFNEGKTAALKLLKKRQDLQVEAQVSTESMLLVNRFFQMEYDFSWAYMVLQLKKFP